MKQIVECLITNRVNLLKMLRCMVESYVTMKTKGWEVTWKQSGCLKIYLFIISK